MKCTVCGKDVILLLEEKCLDCRDAKILEETNDRLKTWRTSAEFFKSQGDQYLDRIDELSKIVRNQEKKIEELEEKLGIVNRK